MSTTGGGCSSLASASPTVGENSRSTSRIFASACSRMKAMVAASRRVLMALRTAPVIGTPKCTSIISGVLAPMTATVSPASMPRRVSAEARRRQRS